MGRLARKARIWKGSRGELDRWRGCGPGAMGFAEDATRDPACSAPVESRLLSTHSTMDRASRGHERPDGASHAASPPGIVLASSPSPGRADTTRERHDRPVPFFFLFPSLWGCSGQLPLGSAKERCGSFKFWHLPASGKPPSSPTLSWTRPRYCWCLEFSSSIWLFPLSRMRRSWPDKSRLAGP